MPRLVVAILAILAVLWCFANPDVIKSITHDTSNSISQLSQKGCN